MNPRQQELSTILSQVDSDLGLSNEDMTALGGKLGELYQEADEAKDVKAKALITWIWDKAQAIHAHAADVGVQAVAIAQVATAAIKQRDAIGEELEGIQDALDSVDDSHPRLQDFAETIRQDAREEYEDWMADEGWPEAMAEAFEDIRVEMVKRIRDMADCDYEAANRFAGIVMGRRVSFTVYQQQVFKSLMENLEGHFEAVAL